jgi:hypothetical protein
LELMPPAISDRESLQLLAAILSPERLITRSACGYWNRDSVGKR